MEDLLKKGYQFLISKVYYFSPNFPNLYPPQKFDPPIKKASATLGLVAQTKVTCSFCIKFNFFFQKYSLNISSSAKIAFFCLKKYWKILLLRLLCPKLGIITFSEARKKILEKLADLCLQILNNFHVSLNFRISSTSCSRHFCKKKSFWKNYFV